MGTLLQSPCDWQDVESVRRDRCSVVVRLRGHQQIRITAFFGRRAREFVESGRSPGVPFEG